MGDNKASFECLVDHNTRQPDPKHMDVILYDTGFRLDSGSGQDWERETLY